MYYISSVCFMCLSEKNVVHQDNDTVYDHIKYVLPEMATSDHEIPVYICSTCHKTFHYFFKFKRLCFKNYRRLQNYMKMLQGANETPDQRFGEVQVNIDNCEAQIKQEDNELTEEFNIKEEIDDLLIISDALESQNDFPSEETVETEVYQETVAQKRSKNKNGEADSNQMVHAGPSGSNENSTQMEEDDTSDFNEDADEDSDFHPDDAGNNSSDYEADNVSQNSKNVSQNITNVSQNSKNVSKPRRIRDPNGVKVYKTIENNAELSNEEIEKLARESLKIAKTSNKGHCLICNRTLVSRIGLKRHLFIHINYRPYPCTECDKRFINKTALQRHLDWHANIRRFECKICNKKCLFRYEFISHMRRHNGQKINCHLCPKQFLCNYNLKKHLQRIHEHEIQKVECPKCYIKFPTQQMLDEHTKYRHSRINTVFVCSICQESFKEKRLYEIHKLTHSGIEYKCSICDKAFLRNYTLKAHIRQHKTGSDIHECKICHDIFPRKIALRDHLVSHINDKEAFICQICCEVFTDLSEFQAHTDLYNLERTDVKCKVCYQRYDSNLYLHNHMRRHNGFREKEEVDLKTPTYVCENCNLSFTRQNLLKNHMDHCHPGTKNLECKICQVKFAKNNDLEEHMTTHTNPKNFTCKTCNKQFTRNSELEEHTCNINELNNQVDKNSSKNFACLICNKQFDRFNELEEHIPTHESISNTSTKNFVCLSCNKQFDRNRELEEHACNEQSDRIIELVENPASHKTVKKIQSSSHKKQSDTNSELKEPTDTTKNLKCLICNKKFDTKSTLTTHLLNHSNSKKIKCLTCNKQFGRNNELEKHTCNTKLKPETDETEKFNCSICNRKFDRISELDEHDCNTDETETVDKFNCVICSEQFLINSELKDHILIKPNTENLECVICNKKYDSQNNLEKHIRTHFISKYYKCLFCILTFDYKIDFDVHMAIHKRVSRNTNHYECLICSKIFDEEDRLVNHNFQIHAVKRYYKCLRVKRKIAIKPPPRNRRSEGCICNICNKLMASKKSLATHMNYHERLSKGIPLIKCSICGTTFSRKGDLEKHMDIHSSVHKFKCDICGKRFPMKLTLKRHMDRHAGKFFDCPHCKTKSITRSVLKRHILLVHGGIPYYKCQICDDMFFNQTYLYKHHKQMHPDVAEVISTAPEIYFRCEICKYKCPDKNSLNVHKAEVHQEREVSIQCTMCEEKCVGKKGLKQHIMDIHFGGESTSTLKTFDCLQCDKNFLQEEFLTQHVIACHTDTINKTCTICNKQFTSEQYLNCHVTRAHGKPNKKRKKVNSKRYCRKCKLKFSSFHNYAKHLHKIHKNDYICIVCNENFATKDDLNVHHKIHGGECECRICNKVFSSIYILRRHMIVAHDINANVKCIVCDKKYPKKDLRTHMIHQHRVPIFQRCSNCNRKFDSVESLENHIAMDHGSTSKSTSKRAYKCIICDRKFATMSSLQTHTKKHSTSCRICNKKFPSLTLTKRHMELHEKKEMVLCTICNKKFFKGKSFQKHLVVFHTVPIIQQLNCAVCDVQFENISLYYEHMTTHEEFEVVDEDEVDAGEPVLEIEV